MFPRISTIASSFFPFLMFVRTTLSAPNPDCPCNKQPHQPIDPWTFNSLPGDSFNSNSFNGAGGMSGLNGLNVNNGFNGMGNSNNHNSFGSGVQPLVIGGGDNHPCHGCFGRCNCNHGNNNHGNNFGGFNNHGHQNSNNYNNQNHGIWTETLKFGKGISGGSTFPISGSELTFGNNNGGSNNNFNTFPPLGESSWQVMGGNNGNWNTGDNFNSFGNQGGFPNTGDWNSNFGNSGFGGQTSNFGQNSNSFPRSGRR